MNAAQLETMQDSLSPVEVGYEIVIDNYPAQYPAGPGTTMWESHVIVDGDGRIIGRRGERHLPHVRLRSPFTASDMETALKDLGRGLAYATPSGWRMQGHSILAEAYNASAAAMDRILS